jgi:hypothetical protein
VAADTVTEGMPTKATTRRAKAKERQGYASTTAAGEFVKEEMHHKAKRKHGRETRKQAIAVGLAKARRAGLDVPPNPNDRPARRRRPARKSSR